MLASSSILARSLKASGTALLLVLLVLVFVPAEYMRLQKRIFDVWTVLTFLWTWLAAGLLLKRPRGTPKTVVTLLILFVAAPVLLWIIGVQWIPFVRVPAHVNVDQHEVKAARVYEGIGGLLLVQFNDSDMHLYLPKQHEVMMCDTYLFHRYGFVGRLEKGKDEYFCMSSKKQEINLDLRVDNRKLAFNRPFRYGTERVTVTR